MTPEKEDMWTQRLAAAGSIIIAGIVVITLLYHEMPEKNEVTLGMVLGFVFGNMVGPVFRKLFGGPDKPAATQQPKDGQ